jgi:uncharacterized repeat protein (TIGR01451 family)
VVNEVNNPPQLAPIQDQVIGEGNTLTVTITAIDSDVPTNRLTYALAAGAPAGASIDPNTGLFSWTPTSAQSPGTNVITVIVTDNGSPNRSDQKTFTVLVVGRASADLIVTQTAAPSPVLLGGNLTYTTIVSNRGPATAVGVVLTDLLPEGATLVSESASQGSCSLVGSGLACSLGALAPGTSASMTIVITPTALGSITNFSVVTANEPDPDPSNSQIKTVTQVIQTSSVSLRIMVSGNNVIISANAPLDGFELQVKENLLSSSDWTTLSNMPVGNTFVVPIDPARRTQFYRVRQRSASTLTLRITTSGGNLIISGNGPLDGYDLQVKDSLSSSADWLTLPNVPVGNQFILPLDSAKRTQFYRAKQR